MLDYSKRSNCDRGSNSFFYNSPVTFKVNKEKVMNRTGVAHIGNDTEDCGVIDCGI